METIEITQGQTYIGYIAVTKVDAITQVETAFSCTGYNAVLILKQGFNDSKPDVLRIAGAWISQSGGTGSVTITNAQSKLLEPDKYAAMVMLYDDAKTIEYPIFEGYFTVKSTVEKDIL